MHTPGPWTIKSIPSTGGESVSAYSVWGPPQDYHAAPIADEIVMRQDAHLISAAPDLLDACRVALTEKADLHPTVEKILRAAIAKAEGRD